jgi:ATP-dependent helicase HrpA
MAALQIRYPEELPVSQHRAELAAAIRDNQVVVVAGETGSGKTTQLPKICLELGRGQDRLIGHTQPRRIAARSVADRIAEELGTTLGSTVGYQVRFTDHTSRDTRIKLMTDGILLAEVQRDPLLRRYDTLIIDEAHERSLNIDFLLGYLRGLLPRRPDLKLIITSATIDPVSFSEHFDNAPVIEVSGRTYPVEIRYRPYGPSASEPNARDDRDQVQAVLDAVDELWTEGSGDILVFCSGEREIRDTADALRRKELPHTEVLPLYARLSAAEQHRVFAGHAGRRVVLATNVAETSLTVPGIHYVVDPGTARISRYSHRLKVQRLPIEPISQASGQQRAGRCGRVAAGVCIRLYDEEDFAARPEFTDPEILRTHLASVILQMTALGLGDVEAFPFLEPPDKRQVRDGRALLHELGAVERAIADEPPRLTALGRRLARLPIDPRLGRMLLEADRAGCLGEALVITAALSIQDPRERPADQQERAQQLHARFADKTSDFLTYLNLWNYLKEQQKSLSSSAFRRLCRTEMLHYLRIREWQDLVSQLRRVSKDIGLAVPKGPLPDEVDAARLHQALLAGLLSHIGLRDTERRDYLGARGARFSIWPGSALAKQPPAWVVAAELVETARLWGRVAAQIQPQWVEPLAGHLVSRSYSEPHWSSRRGAVMAYERVTLYGVPLVTQRRISYGAIDRELSRELFIWHALVQDDWTAHHAFIRANQERIAEIEQLEAKVRRRDLLADDQARFDFFDARVPADVVSQRHFDRWWKRTKAAQPDLLTLDDAVLIAGDVAGTADRFSDATLPSAWSAGDVELPLTYEFEPGGATDGVTVHVPLDVLGQLDPAAFSWQVPGLREELVVALIRSLPKAIRRSYVPAPNFAAAAVQEMAGRVGVGEMRAALAQSLQGMGGPRIEPEDWGNTPLPPHLVLTFAIHQGSDTGSPVLATGPDLAVLAARLAPRTAEALGDVTAQVGPDVRRSGLRTWSADEPDLPAVIEVVRAGATVRGYPALVDDDDSVSIQVLGDPDEAAASHARGLRRLLALDLPSPATAAVRSLSTNERLALGASQHAGGTVGLLADCRDAGLDQLVHAAGSDVRSAAAYAELRARVRAELPATYTALLAIVIEILIKAQAVRRQIRETTSLALLSAVTDVRGQLDDLLPDGFATAVGADRLPDLLRYLTAAEVRLTRVADHLRQDDNALGQVRAAESEIATAIGRLPRAAQQSAAARDLSWMVQELRVSLFAPTLRTAYPVSDQRIRRAIAALSSSVNQRH